MMRRRLSSWSPAVSVVCFALSVIALEEFVISWSTLAVRVFPRSRLQASGCNVSMPLVRWAVHWRLVVSGDVFVCETTVMEQSLSQFFQGLCDVFLRSSIILVKESHLRAGALTTDLRWWPNLPTTPTCQKEFVGFLAALAPRLQNQMVVQRVAHPRNAYWHVVMSVSSDACRPGPSLFEVKSVSLLPTFLASNSLTCCLPVTPRSVPPQSRMASSICGGFLPITRWLALYPLPLILDALA